MSLCACGCGRETRVSPYQPVKSAKANRYILGHSGGRKLSKEPFIDGEYIMVWAPNCTRALASGYAPEHIVLAEKALGRPIPKGVEVHHADGNKLNNKSNLVICQDTRYHNLLHIRLNAFRACGNANWRKCSYCKCYDAIENLHTVKEQATMFHRACATEYCRLRRQDKKCPK